MEENKIHEEHKTELPREHKDETLDETELEEVLDSVPPEHRKMIEKMMISSVQMRSVSSPEAEVMKKLTPEHISRYLEGAEQEMKNSYAEKFHKKVFTFLSMIIAMVFIIVIIILLKETPDIMEKIIYTAGGVVIGAFGGYGFGKNHNDE